MNTASTQTIHSTSRRDSDLAQWLSTNPSEREFFNDLCADLAHETKSSSVTICEAIDYPTTRVAILAYTAPQPIDLASVIRIQGRPSEKIFENGGSVVQIAGCSLLEKLTAENVEGLNGESVDEQNPKPDSDEVFCGIPLVSSEGKVLGFISLIGQKWKSWSQTDRVKLMIEQAAFALEKREFRKTRISFLEKLESVSRKAMLTDIVAKTAFELNQPLTVIENLTYYAKRSCQSEESDRDYVLAMINQSLEDISNEVQRAGDDLRHIKELAHRHEQIYQSCHFQDVAKDVIPLVEVACRKNGITLLVNISENAIPARIKLHQIQHALWNLIQNSIEELSRLPGTHEDSNPAPKNSSSDSYSMSGEDNAEKPRRKAIVVDFRVDRGNWVITVNDSGRGVPQSRQNRIFDAFSTDKQHSFGIGLHVCQAIVESHEGKIKTVPGSLSGLSIQMTLPAGIS